MSTAPPASVHRPVPMPGRELQHEFHGIAHDSQGPGGSCELCKFQQDYAELLARVQQAVASRKPRFGYRPVKDRS